VIAGAGETPIQEVSRLLVENDARTAFICDDVVEALNEGRRCFILSQWTERCHLLAEGLRARGVSPLILEGSLGKRARAAIITQIENRPPGEQLVIVATGQYLGEGFDSPQLDALFLAFPVSFKGRLIQYTGRLMRAEEGKTTVRVYDYVDSTGTRAARDARAPPQNLQVARIHPRPCPRRRVRLPACGSDAWPMRITLTIIWPLSRERSDLRSTVDQLGGLADGRRTG
jgi:superfamily II DNA or RNA helicase